MLCLTHPPLHRRNDVARLVAGSQRQVAKPAPIAQGASNELVAPPEAGSCCYAGGGGAFDPWATVKALPALLGAPGIEITLVPALLSI